MAVIIKSLPLFSLPSWDDRCARREQLIIPALLRPTGGARFDVTVTNIAVSGFSCNAVTGMHPGERCWLTIGGLRSLAAEIIWNDHSAIGCAFSTLLHPAVLDGLLVR